MPNQLTDATSPYLLQHADNPVDWHQWGKEALTLAESTDRPILLSIGYSACHWCHVMAHESFEDAATAEVMNRLFVNIKVDREERPDLDSIYQTAHQLLAQRPGGWPLTVFLTPHDQLPFFAGTYFPPVSRHGLPAFVDLLEGVANAYRTQRSEISEQNQAMLQALAGLNPDGGRHQQLDTMPLEGALDQLSTSFDERHGGFGQAPKFPHPSHLALLLRSWAQSRVDGREAPRIRYLAEYTLTRMVEGGIYDQLGGGFCRYSVDPEWMIPHFEKMLYDNGPLLALCCDLWQISGNRLFRDKSLQTAEWIRREMQSPQGGYYSTLDADSEGEEGLFYVWEKAQVELLLEPDEYRHLATRFGLDRPANFEGRWHLHTFASIAELNERYGSSGESARALLESARHKLFSAREERVRPGRDEKILTSWNALMIKGMARAGRLLGKPACLSSAEAALGFVRQNLWVDGRLLATHKDGRSHLSAYLDDYAYLIDALLELLQCRWRVDDLAFAIELAESLLEHFQDRNQGGFFFTADDHETLIHRPKPFSDDSTPAGNGVAALVLLRLGYLLGNGTYTEAAERTLHCAWAQIRQQPYAHATLLEALERLLLPSETIVLRGEGEALERWHRRATEHYAPRRDVFAIPANCEGLPQLLAARRATEVTVAYLCQGSHCETPITSFDNFETRLRQSECVT
ncbi:MAG: thioredoxin domain-containing protein [Gammaproteobacteria bacterium]|nr:thioredoxin domain-containing protein [Gammaproteobacteria bacterium]